jgi:hypothetical protein
MKVNKWVTVEKEIEVEIEQDDIVAAIHENGGVDGVQGIYRVLSALFVIMDAIKEDDINKMPQKNRETIRNYMMNQAQRFEKK